MVVFINGLTLTSALAYWRHLAASPKTSDVAIAHRRSAQQGRDTNPDTRLEFQLPSTAKEDALPIQSAQEHCSITDQQQDCGLITAANQPSRGGSMIPSAGGVCRIHAHPRPVRGFERMIKDRGEFPESVESLNIGCPYVVAAFAPAPHARDTNNPAAIAAGCCRSALNPRIHNKSKAGNPVIFKDQENIMKHTKKTISNSGITHDCNWYQQQAAIPLPQNKLKMGGM